MLDGSSLTGDDRVGRLDLDREPRIEEGREAPSMHVEMDDLGSLIVGRHTNLEVVQASGLEVADRTGPSIHWRRGSGVEYLLQAPRVCAESLRAGDKGVGEAELGVIVRHAGTEVAAEAA
jgi:hypothetical protein